MVWLLSEEHNASQSFLGHFSIVKSKCSAKDTDTLGCFELHCWLNTQTYRRIHTAPSGQHLPLHKYKSKELGYESSCPGPSFPMRENSGRNRNEQYAALPSASDQCTYYPCKQIQTEKQERKESETSFSH